MGTTSRKAKSRLSLIVVCCLTATNFMSPKSVGQIASSQKLELGQINASILSKAGPVFVAYYSASNISLRGFVRTAPFVASYRLGRMSTATITFTVRLKKEEKSFPFHFEQTGDECRDWVFHLPEEFGKKPLVATITVSAKNRDPNDKRPPDFELCGLGMGEKAVGSMGIERVKFKAARFRATQKEKVGYSFYSRFNFENAYAEFRLMGQASSGGVLGTRMVKSEKISNISKGESVSGEWDGKDERGKISRGRHQLVVAAWYREKKGGDWTSAWSQERVFVE